VTPQPLPARRFVVLSKQPGRIAVSATSLLDEDTARAKLGELFSRPQVRATQYALAELQLVEQYR
jgi:hypothetical protein